MAEENGRIKLSWGQFAWGLSTLVLVLSAWFDLRTQVKLVAVAVEEHGRRIVAIEARNRNAGFTQQDGEELKQELLKEIKNPRRGR